MILQCKFVFLMTNFIGKEYIMKVSTKGRYALRLMLDLAVNNTGEPISLKDIARRQGISDNRHDSQTDRGKSCAGSMRGRREYL